MKSDNEQQQFIPLKGYEDDYEICNEYPHQIRRKRDGYILKESIRDDGYIQIALNGIPQRKHRLIALQFIPNDDPEHKTKVDHMNKNRSDNHISNLRWVTSSTNNYNKTSHKGVQYQYVDDIPDEAMVVDDYVTRNGIRYFDNYYYHEGVFYYDNEINYRILHVNQTKSGTKYVNMKSVDGTQTAVCIVKFLKYHDMEDDIDLF